EQNQTPTTAENPVTQPTTTQTIAQTEPALPTADPKTAATDAKEPVVETTAPTDGKPTTPPVDPNATKTAATVSTTPAATVPEPNAADATTTPQADPKTAVEPPAETTPQQPTATDYPSAKAKTDHANDLVAQANQSAAALQALLQAPKPGDPAWQAQVNAALTELTNTAGAFSGTQVATDEVVTAYEAALKAMPTQPQPNAVQSVQTGGKNETATLANYNELVATYAAQVQTLLAQVQAGQANYATAEALNAAQQQLKAAADQLNAAIQQAVTRANAGDTSGTHQAVTAPDTAGHTLDDYKQAYDDALTAYNSQVIAYNNTNPAVQQPITPLDTNADTATTPDPTKNPAAKTYTDFKAEVAKTAAQNNAYNHYETANAAYHQAQSGFTDLAGAVTAWQTAANNYNQMVSGVNAGTTAKLTEADLQAQQAAVTNAQTNLAKAVNQFTTVNTTYQVALEAYQTALDTYTTATGQATQQAAPGYDPSNPTSPWHQFQAISPSYKLTLRPPGRLVPRSPGKMK
ncbi:hypothetical protein, partial [Agrilactobacillus composti]|uniref:hypothetical protein n=1 Tax=Agrilactobacillus composti TaxID=398555 RepID=UPI00055222E6